MEENAEIAKELMDAASSEGTHETRSESHAHEAQETRPPQEVHGEKKAEGDPVTRHLQLSNLVCESCEKVIEKSVRELPGVRHIKASYAASTAEVTYNPEEVSLREIEGAIKKEGYGAKIRKAPFFDQSQKRLAYIAAGTIALLAMIIGYIFVSNTVGALNITVPQLDANTSLILVFVVGLLTGFHCIGMCGSFVLSYTAKARKDNPDSLNLSLHAKYAAGKLISYSVIGGIFGLVGSIFVFSPALRAGIAIFAGAFLILFGLKMLNISPVLRKVSLPHGIFNRLRIGAAKKSNSSPFIIGLLNGLFIACGPLQAMYILAMTAGSFLGGAMLLFAFALGTLIPMLGFGVFASFISHGIKNRIVMISGIVVLIMGILMINNGLALSGSAVSLENIGSSFGAGVGTGDASIAKIDGNAAYQVIEMAVTNNGWSPNSFVLKKGVPVKWIINGQQLTGCNSSIVVPAYNLSFSIKPGKQTIEFTPTTEEVVQWSCSMGMMRGTFVVKDNVGIDSTGKVTTDAQTQAEVKRSLASAPAPSGGGCSMGSGGGGCGCGGGK